MTKLESAILQLKGLHNIAGDKPDIYITALIWKAEAEVMLARMDRKINEKRILVNPELDVIDA